MICASCNGSGEIRANPGWPDPQTEVTTWCRQCGGDGSVCDCCGRRDCGSFEDPPRYCLQSDEAKAQKAAYDAATPEERAEVIGLDSHPGCEHLDTEDLRCLECGEWVIPDVEYDDV